MRLRRLGWAGVEMEHGGETLVIDYVRDTTPMQPVLRSPDEPFPASMPGVAVCALMTHLHADHADADAVAAALRPGAPVLRPEPATGNTDDLKLTAYGEQKFARGTLPVVVTAPWQDYRFGPFEVSSAPAVDGFGDPQLTWIVACKGKRILHAGDTLFHGLWWRIAHRYGPFDAAFLPINAPICTWPHLQPASPIAATLTPEEAAVAANILGAKSVVPIHYGSLKKAGQYVETTHPVERLESTCEALGIRAMPLEPGVWTNLT